jgi:VWFA-related protein
MCSKFSRVCSILLMSVLVSAGLKAQALPCPRQTVPVTVSDAKGRMITGLKAVDFGVHVHGHPATITNYVVDTGPRRIALVLDASGSMIKDGGQWNQTITLAKTLVEGLPREDSVAFVAFASQVDRKIGFTQDRRPILEELDDLRGGSKVIPKNMRETALWDSALEASRLFDLRRVGDAIYIMTDGDDNYSHASRSDVEGALVAAGVRFFPLLPPSIDLVGGSRTKGNLDVEASLETQTRKTLEDVADNTGGALFTFYDRQINGARVPFTPGELGVALKQLSALTHEFYRLEIELPQPNDKNRDWKIEVVDPIRKDKSTLVARYPHKLTPCDARP